MSEGNSSYQPNRGNRRFRIPSNPWLPYVGDCKALENFLATKEGWGWMFPKFLNALLRGVGQVVFCNNPLTGLIILLSLFWADLIVGLATVLAASTAIVTAIIFRQDVAAISNGLISYNAVLIGSVTAALWTPLYKEEMSLVLWAFIMISSALSVFVNTALGNLLSSFKQPLPALTFPFNIVTLLLFVCLMPHPQGPIVPIGPNNASLTGVAMELVSQEEVGNNTLRVLREAVASSSNMDLDNATMTDTLAIAKARIDPNVLDWGLVMKGIFLSMGQVYGVNDLIASIFMYIATLVYSPTVFMMSFLGAILSSIFGILLDDAPYGSVYDGIWGFNGILSAVAVGGVFFVLTLHSLGTALANVLFTVMIQYALRMAFGPINLPYFTLPFVLSTFIFLQMTSVGDNLKRVTKITFPEMQRFEYLAEHRESAGSRQEGKKRDTTDEIAEEKELVLKEVKVIMEVQEDGKGEEKKMDEKDKDKTERKAE